MAMTAAQLREHLSNIEGDTPVYFLFDGAIAPVDSFLASEAASLAIIRCKGKPRKSKQFNTTEDGLIGGLDAMGATDEMIAELLDRPTESITRRKKKLGI